MAWNKVKQRLESFMTPSLIKRVEYLPTGYRYAPDKKGRSFIRVDKKEVFNMLDESTHIQWFDSEQEIKSNPNLYLPISKEDLMKIENDANGEIPKDRILVIAKSRKIAEYAKQTMLAQNNLVKADFYEVVNTYLTTSVEKSLESDQILLNILAIIDRRIGKKRLSAIENDIRLKHPVVQYFYDLRCKG